MSPKKPYQRRLPTVLPPVQLPVQRVAPELESLPPAADLLPEPDVVPELPLDPDPEPDLKPDPEPDPEPRDRRVKVGLVALAWLVGLGALVGALALGLRDDPATPGAGGSADPPRALAPAEAYVDTQVLPAGDLVVRQWIRTREPLTALGLEVPVVPGAEDLSADHVEVVADGVVASGPDRVTAAGATYTFQETTTVMVTYRLAGATQVSDSVAGRALANVTALDTTYAPPVERETRVVHGPEVLSLACSRRPDGSPEPCGRDGGNGEWQVELSGDRVDDRVLAQLNLG